MVQMGSLMTVASLEEDDQGRLALRQDLHPPFSTSTQPSISLQKPDLYLLLLSRTSSGCCQADDEHVMYPCKEKLTCDRHEGGELIVGLGRSGVPFKSRHLRVCRARAAGVKLHRLLHYAPRGNHKRQFSPQLPEGYDYRHQSMPSIGARNATQLCGQIMLSRRPHWTMANLINKVAFDNCRAYTQEVEHRENLSDCRADGCLLKGACFSCRVNTACREIRQSMSTISAMLRATRNRGT